MYAALSHTEARRRIASNTLDDCGYQDRLMLKLVGPCSLPRCLIRKTPYEIRGIDMDPVLGSNCKTSGDRGSVVGLPCKGRMKVPREREGTMYRGTCV